MTSWLNYNLTSRYGKVLWECFNSVCVSRLLTNGLSAWRRDGGIVIKWRVYDGTDLVIGMVVGIKRFPMGNPFQLGC